MHTAYLVVTVLAAVAAAIAAGVDIVRPDWVRANMNRYGIPDRTLYPLAAVKAIGALGLLVGLAFPPLAAAAAAGLVLYFILAIGTILRAHVYADLGYPLPYLILAAASLGLFAAA